MKGNMKVWIVVATWFCFTIAFGLARVTCPSAENHYHNYTVDTSPSFIITRIPAEDKSRYQQFMVNLRDKLAYGTPSNGIQVLRATASKGDKYILVKLKNSGDKEITLGINVINAYVVAYRVVTNSPKTKDNSYFFNDAKELKDAKTYLFKDTNQITLDKFTGSYDSLKAEGGDREKVDLGVGKLDSFIYTLHETTVPNKIAKPLVCVIQMVSEAARFKYIEQKIVDKIEGSFTPKLDVISRENNWDNLSRAIQTADQKGNIKKEFQVTLKDEKGSRITISNINQVKGDMGILKKYVAKISFNPSLEQTADLIQNDWLPLL
uniref:rRNA N-glycosylase n=1 Tax=Vernicia fordii TaxID=73154 RepID=A0A4D6TZ65_VERFO|nr:RIP2 [Vernicia fordii]